MKQQNKINNRIVMTKLVTNIYQKSLREMKQYYNNVQVLFTTKVNKPKQNKSKIKD